MTGELMGREMDEQPEVPQRVVGIWLPRFENG